MIGLGILVLLAVAYLLGSIPFGLLLTRAAGLGDVRAIGSGNIGATNVLRTGNKKLAGFTLLLDAAKGAVAISLLRGLLPAELAMDPMTKQLTLLGGSYAYMLGLMALLGHIYPVWLGFKGGKGVATLVGVLCVLPYSVSTFAMLWLVVFFFSRISSLAALTAVGYMLVQLLLALGTFATMLYPTFDDPGLCAVFMQYVILCVMCGLVIYTHRANIARLRAGTEPKFAAKA